MMKKEAVLELLRQAQHNLTHGRGCAKILVSCAYALAKSRVEGARKEAVFEHLVDAAEQVEGWMQEEYHPEIHERAFMHSISMAAAMLGQVEPFDWGELGK